MSDNFLRLLPSAPTRDLDPHSTSYLPGGAERAERRRGEDEPEHGREGRLTQSQRTNEVSYGWLIAAEYGMTRTAYAWAPLSWVGISPP